MTKQLRYNDNGNNFIFNDDDASVASPSSLPSSPLLSEDNIHVNKNQTVTNNDQDNGDFIHSTIMTQEEDEFNRYVGQQHEQQKQRCSLENDDDHRQSIPLIMKAFPFTMLLTLVLLYMIHSDYTYTNQNYNNSKSHNNIYNFSPTPPITTRILNEDTGSNTMKDENEKKTEILCRKEYSTVADLSYTYYLETKIGTDATQTIKHLEMVMLHHLTDALLFCSYETRQRDRQKRMRRLQGENGEGSFYDDEDFMDRLIEDYSLKIVGVSSTPDDVPSTKSTCIPNEGQDCTVVVGSLNLFLKNGADLSSVRYATRYAIRDSMLNDIYTSVIPGLEAVNYVGPRIIRPPAGGGDSLNEPAAGYTDGSSYEDVIGNGGTSGKTNGISRLEVVVTATLISTLVGLIGTFILFKKIYSKQKCIPNCDGSGIDKDYIQNCHNDRGINTVPTTESGNEESSISTVKSVGWNMNSLIASRGVLTAIDENSMAPSEGYGSSAMSISTNKSSALKSVSSVHSDQTMVIRNGHRGRQYSTPTYGNYDGENRLEVI